MRSVYPLGWNEGLGSIFRDGYRLRQTTGEGWLVHHKKCCEYNNYDAGSNRKAYNNYNSLS